MQDCIGGGLVGLEAARKGRLKRAVGAEYARVKVRHRTEHVARDKPPRDMRSVCNQPLSLIIKYKYR